MSGRQTLSFIPFGLGNTRVQVSTNYYGLSFITATVWTLRGTSPRFSVNKDASARHYTNARISAINASFGRSASQIPQSQIMAQSTLAVPVTDPQGNGVSPGSLRTQSCMREEIRAAANTSNIYPRQMTFLGTI
jgi:hypothetical protein